MSDDPAQPISIYHTREIVHCITTCSAVHNTVLALPSIAEPKLPSHPFLFYPSPYEMRQVRRYVLLEIQVALVHVLEYKGIEVRTKV